MWTKLCGSLCKFRPPGPPHNEIFFFTEPLFHCDGGRESGRVFGFCPHIVVGTGSIFGGCRGSPRFSIYHAFFSTEKCTTIADHLLLVDITPLFGTKTYLLTARTHLEPWP